MGLARQEAQRYHHQYIGTEHFLLGLIQADGGTAHEVLRNLDVCVGRIQTEVEKLTSEGPTMVTMGQLPFTPRAKRALELSSDAACELEHNYIGTEHLLLGLIREGEGAGAQALLNLGLTPQALHTEVMETLGVVTTYRKEASTQFDGYQKFSQEMAVYPGAGTGSFEAITYCALKGGGECGEFLEKLGKHMRKQGSITALNRAALGEDLRLALAKELGDRLWYIAAAAGELGYTLSEIADINIEKLLSRRERGVIVGEGDDR